MLSMVDANRSKRFTQAERGVYITLVALFGLILLGLTALVIDLGFIAVAQNRLQHVVNLVTLSSIEQYVRYVPPQGSGDQEFSRRELTVKRANQILRSNSVWGIEADRLTIKIDDAKSIRFGKWYREDPDGTGPSSPCTSYPCFQEVGEGMRGDAIRIVVRNETDNPFTRFFGQIFGSSVVTIEAEATGTLVKRCMAFLLDLSLSATADTHTLPKKSQEPIVQDNLDPLRQSVAFYGKDYDDGDPGLRPCYPVGKECTDTVETEPPNLGLFAQMAPPSRCTFETLNPEAGVVNYGSLMWCSLPISREMARDTSPPLDESLGYHFRDDYEERETPWASKIFFDLRTKPEPFTTFLNGFNAALRAVYAEASNADQAMLAGFSQSVALEGVKRRYPQDGLSEGRNGIALLTHLTNIKNIGYDGSPVTPPTVLDLGIFPLYGAGASSTVTNLAGAIESTIDDLNSSCGITDQKIIVVATDGIANCYVVGSGANRMTVCDGRYIGYVNAENRLLNTINGTIRKLIDNRVALTALHTGDSVRPNFKKIPTTCPNPPDGTPENDCLLDYDAALRGGYSSGMLETGDGFRSCDTDARSFIDCRSFAPSEGLCAQPLGPQYFSGCEPMVFQKLSQPGNFFGRPAMMLAELALQSGGRYCPIVPVLGGYNPGNSNYIDHDGDASTPKRLKASAVVGDTVTHSLELLSPGEQAGACAQLAVGANPFVLVEE